RGRTDANQFKLPRVDELINSPLAQSELERRFPHSKKHGQAVCHIIIIVIVAAGGACLRLALLATAGSVFQRHAQSSGLGARGRAFCGPGWGSAEPIKPLSRLPKWLRNPIARELAILPFSAYGSTSEDYPQSVGRCGLVQPSPSGGRHFGKIRPPWPIYLAVLFSSGRDVPNAGVGGALDAPGVLYLPSPAKRAPRASLGEYGGIFPGGRSASCCRTGGRVRSWVPVPRLRVSPRLHECRPKCRFGPSAAW